MAVVTPSSGSLTLTGSTARLNRDVRPAVGALTLTGNLALIKGLLNPGMAVLRLVGYEPIIDELFDVEDNFDRNDPGDLGTQWEQVYSGPGASTYETDKGKARWFPAGDGEREVINKFLGVNQKETIALAGRVDGGTFTLTFAGQTTAPIPYNATPAEVQAALEALPNINIGDVEVTDR